MGTASWGESRDSFEKQYESVKDRMSPDGVEAVEAALAKDADRFNIATEGGSPEEMAFRLSYDDFEILFGAWGTTEGIVTVWRKRTHSAPPPDAAFLQGETDEF